MLSLFSHPPYRPRPRVLRYYQRTAIANVGAVLHKRPILVAPTGAGKTVMASAIVSELSMPTLWLAHRQELIDQAAKSLQANGLHVGIIKSGREPDPSARTQVASVQTLARRDKPAAQLIIIDECHHAAAGSYRSILESYPSAYVAGLTATPFRLDGRGLGDLFGEIVVSAYTDELVAQGWLHAPRVYAGAPPDLRGVKVTGGDYNLGQLAQRMTNTAEVVETWKLRANGCRSVLFAVNVEHSQQLVAAFIAAGIAAEHLDGSMPMDARALILRRLASGETSIVSNCMVLTEGWDLPTLQCAIVCRPTASLNLHLQMIGRVMRSADGKDGAIVLDHAGNHHVHGLVTRRLKYSLDGSIKVGQADPLGLRQCGQCFILYENTLASCPECGHTPTPAQRVQQTITGIGGELGEFVEDFDYRRRIWNLIEAERELSSYKPAWSLFRYEERFGARPVVAEVNGVRELVDPAHASMVEKEAVYASLMQIVADKKLSPGWASHRYREMFGVWPRGFVSRAAVNDKWARMTGVKA